MEKVRSGIRDKHPRSATLLHTDYINTILRWFGGAGSCGGRGSLAGRTPGCGGPDSSCGWAQSGGNHTGQTFTGAGHGTAALLEFQKFFF